MRRIAVCGWVLGTLVGSLLAEPVLEYAPAPDGPWTAVAETFVAERADGSWSAGAAAEDAARFYRVVDLEGGVGFCVMGIRAATRVGFLPQALDSDGDTVPDCVDACPGQDDQLDADGDGLADGCDPEPQIPLGMALVPAGPFAMGDPFGTGRPEERPVHTVEVSAFFADQHEVRWVLWQAVRAWAVEHGYELSPGAGKGADHPVQLVSWYDAIKWCNARSERAGLTPVYRTAAGEVYRTGEVDLRNEDVLWTADGFRLPTEAEWEKAARGGLVGQQFPWGSQVDGSLANYGSSGDAYEAGAQPWTTPVGLYVANGYGLCDMAGNVFEWCWDWWDAGWYSTPDAVQADPRGPTTAGTYRVVRGGSWFWTPYAMRCAYRGWDEPRYRGDGLGLRCVRTRTAPGARAVLSVGAVPPLRLAAVPPPTLEYAVRASGPWQEDSNAVILEGVDGGWEAMAVAGAGYAYRLVQAGAELPFCVMAVHPAVILEVLSAGRDSDGDTVSDCDDRWPGHDDRKDTDGDGVPDMVDACPGHDDRIDVDGDGVPDACGPPWYRNLATGHWYRISARAGSFVEVEQEAVGYGGHLVTIDDEQENRFLVETFGTMDTGSTRDIWIGLHESSAGRWSWVSGEGGWWEVGNPQSTSYVNWAPGFPVNIGRSEGCGVPMGKVAVNHRDVLGRWGDIVIGATRRTGLIEVDLVP